MKTEKMVLEDRNYADEPLMSKMDMKPLRYEYVAKDWDNNPNDWYNAVIMIEDLPIGLSRS